MLSKKTQANLRRYMIGLPQISSSFRDESEWTDFQDTLFGCCLEAWKVVKPILCIDSPEGQADDEVVQDVDIGIKDTLSFSWRTLKESRYARSFLWRIIVCEILIIPSSLMQAVISHTAYGFQGKRNLRYEDYKNLGDLAFTQLSKLRHRGAFSAVAQCFTACCIECGQCTDPRTMSLLDTWYAQTISSIDRKASALTRRSAGLPAMMTAILTSNPDGHLFDTAVEELQSIASRPVSMVHKHGKSALPQVHSMNCIKDIFSNTQLGPSAERYLESSLHIAVQSLNHDIWSIRNCGGMLLKAILNRLSGGSIGHTSKVHQYFTKTLYSKYPSLADIVESLLDSSISADSTDLARNTTRQVNNGFPALDIIHCIGIRGDQRRMIKDLLHLLLGSPVWSLRERVAITLSRFFGCQTFVDELFQTIKSDVLADRLQFNSLHGRILCIRKCLPDLSKTDRRGLLIDVISLAEVLMVVSCPPVRSAYLELLIDLVSNLLDSILPGNDQSLFNVLNRLRLNMRKDWKDLDLQDTIIQSTHRAHVYIGVWIYCYTEGHSPDILLDELNASTVAELVRKHPAIIPSLYGRHDLIRMVKNCVVSDQRYGRQAGSGRLSTVRNLIDILNSDYSRSENNIVLNLKCDNKQREELNAYIGEILMACKTLEGGNQLWKSVVLELRFALIPDMQELLSWHVWSKMIYLAVSDQLVKFPHRTLLPLLTITGFRNETLGYQSDL